MKKPQAKPTASEIRKFAEQRPSKSGQVPEGHKRLTVNLPAELHRAIKLAAVQEGVTIGALIERWARQNL